MGMLRDSKFSQLGLLHMGGVFFKRQNHGRDLFFERELLVILSFPPRYNHMYNYKYIICMVVRIFLGGGPEIGQGKVLLMENSGEGYPTGGQLRSPQLVLCMPNTCNRNTSSW